MREQLLLLIRISKPEYNKCLYDEYKLYMNPQMSFNKVGLTDGQYDKYEGAITDIPCKILYSMVLCQELVQVKMRNFSPF